MKSPVQRLKTSADVTGAGCGPVFDSVVVLGPTACGKTSLAVHIARLFSGEIISADSRQVYRNLDIGTGKDLAEYGGIPYHLIDIISLPEEYNVFRFRKDFYSVLPEIQRRGKLPVLAGGTGLYLDSVIRNYDFTEVPENPELRLSLEKLDDKLLFERLSGLKTARGEKVHPDDTVDRERLIRAIEIAECSSARADTTGPSVRFNPFVLGIRFPREEIRTRIKTRLDSRLNDGMVEEVEALHKSGISWERLDRLGLEYRHVSRYLQGLVGFAEFRDVLFTEICRFAKRQETWFRRMERCGVEIRWIERGDRTAAEETLVNAGFLPE